MTTPNSNDFFSDMGAGSPPVRPKTTLARPPPPKATGAGSTGVAPLKKAPPAGVRPAGRTSTAGRTTSPGAGRTGATGGRTSAAAGRGSSAVRPAGRRPVGGAGTTATGRAGRGAGGRTSAAGRRPTGARGTRPASATTTTTTPGGFGAPAAAAAPVGGTGFYGASSSTNSTHLSSTTPTNNPYAAGGTNPASSDAWFGSPQSTTQQTTTPTAMNPYATTPTDNSAAPANNNAFQGANVSQWQTPQPMQQQPNVNQWQQPQQQQQQNQQNQQLQALASMGGSFLMNSMMNTQQPSNAAGGGQPYDPSSSSTDIDIENEPPLLEELGINIDHIRAKTLAVILPFQRVSGATIHMEPSMIVEDADLAGPLIFALALGGELMMTGKLHFGYIYGFGLFGCLALTLILNLMTPKEAISVWTVTSILGYALLPVNILAAVKIIVVNIIRLETFGRILALVAVLWSTVASTRLLEVGCGLRHQRYLIGYPIAMLYSAFVLLTIF